MIIGYRGMQRSGYFARHEFQSMDDALQIAWEDGGIWGLHDTDIEITPADKEWARLSVMIAGDAYVRA